MPQYLIYFYVSVLTSDVKLNGILIQSFHHRYWQVKSVTNIIETKRPKKFRLAQGYP